MGREEFGKEVHVYAPAYTRRRSKASCASPTTSISIRPSRSRASCRSCRRRTASKVGIRINPGYSNATLGGALYDPCAPYSRFGTDEAEIDQMPWEAIDIFHAHALCESLHDGSVGLIEHVAREFAPYIRRVKAVNFGGGHFINKPGYDVDALIAGHQGVPRRVRRRGDPGAGRGPGRRCRLSRRQRHRHPPQREGHRHPRRVGELPHAGRARGALPAADLRRRRARRDRAQLHPRRQDLHDRRHHRRVFVRQAAGDRRPHDASAT